MKSRGGEIGRRARLRNLSLWLAAFSQPYPRRWPGLFGIRLLSPTGEFPIQPSRLTFPIFALLKTSGEGLSGTRLASLAPKRPSSDDEKFRIQNSKFKIHVSLHPPFPKLNMTNGSTLSRQCSPDCASQRSGGTDRVCLFPSVK